MTDPAGALTAAHIQAEARLRQLTVQAIAAAWAALGSYDERDVPAFLAAAVPVVAAAQRQSVSLTAAYLARAIDRPAVGVDIDSLLAGLRNGTPSTTVYRRPFVSVWTALRDEQPYDSAVAAGLERATGSAAMDVQLAMTHTLREIGGREDLILGYRRVPDADACSFCRLIAGQRYTTDQLMPVHNRCGCGVGVITEANRGDFTGNPENDLSVTRDDVSAVVRDHGELGPLVVNGAHAFTGPADLS